MSLHVCMFVAVCKLVQFVVPEQALPIALAV